MTPLRNMTAEDWTTEVDYIEQTAKLPDPGSNFNFDRACFVRYCRMQCASATREGLYPIAEAIARVLAKYDGAREVLP